MAKLSTYKTNPGINPLDKITYSGIIEDYEDLPTYETVTNTLEDLGLFFAGNYFSTDGINYNLASIDGRITALENQVESDPVFALWDRSAGISITESQISDLKTYLTSYTETDPVFTAHTAYNIANATTAGFLRNDNGTWSYDTNTYLTSYTETDTLDTVTGRNSVTTNSISVGTITATGNHNFFSGQQQGPYRSALFSSSNSNRVGIYANLAAEDLYPFSQNGDGAIQSIYYAGAEQEELTQGMIIGAPYGSAMRFDGFNAVIHTGVESSTAVIIDQDQNATFNGGITSFGNITSESFIHSSGSSSDFLKGDGSLDSSSYPALDTNDKIPALYFPDSITGSLSYEGAWDASTETFPTTPSTGDMYAVETAGTFGDPAVIYNVGDWIIYNGTTWDHIQNGVLVTSVAGKTGTVTIDVNDLSDTTITSPSNGQVLKYNGSKWVNSAEYSYTAPSGTVVDSNYSHITVTASSVSDGTTTFSKYSLPTSSSTVLGGVKIGYTESGKNYPVELNASNQMFVNVPWTDSVYALPTATTSTLGGVKLGSDSVQSVAAQTPSVTAARTYAVQVNSTGKMVVNVPWTDSNTVYTHPTLTTTKNTATSTLSHDGTFKAITAVTTNTTGHLSDYTETTFTLPSDVVGDTNVQADWNETGATSDAYIKNKPTSMAPTSHTHGNITNDGKIGTTSGLMVKTTTDGKLATLDAGTAGQFLKHDGTWATPNYTTNTDTNYYLDGITKDGNTLTFSVNGTTNQTYEFGSNAFTSTTIPTGALASLDSVTDAQIDANSVGASELKVSGNGLTGQVLTSDADGSFSWTTLSTYTHPDYPETDVDTSGAKVIDTINIVNGHINSFTYRDLSLADLGYSGAVDANKYVHPTHPGDDISIDTEVLSGATVISNLDFNVTTDTLGHVTDANATYNTRNLTPADIGAAASSHTHSYLPLSGGTITGTTDSTSKDTGALIIEGGLGVEKNIYAGGDIVADISSDKRLKDNIKNISDPIEKLKKINGVEFDWNDNQSTYEGHDLGVIAQEIQAVMPEIVNERSNGYLAVKYDRIVALLIEAVKEQQKQIDELKKWQ